jgi:hypothetical protein
VVTELIYLTIAPHVPVHVIGSTTSLNQFHQRINHSKSIHHTKKYQIKKFKILGQMGQGGQLGSINREPDRAQPKLNRPMF